MKGINEYIVEKLNKRDEEMWKLIDEINFKDMLKNYKGDRKSADEIFDKIVDILKSKLIKGEIHRYELMDIASNIRGHAQVLFDKGGKFWGRGDDGCYDISTAAVGLGKENYEKCLSDENWLKSMKKVTKEYENYMYPFNEVIDPS